MNSDFVPFIVGPSTTVDAKLATLTTTFTIIQCTMQVDPESDETFPRARKARTAFPARPQSADGAARAPLAQSLPAK